MGDSLTKGVKMAVRYEDVTPVYENTTMKKMFINEAHKLYNIYPVEDYVLHDKDLDIVIYDDITGEEISRELWYTPTYSQFLPNYDFVANPREIYAVPRNTVPENQILGGGENDHETI